MLPADFNKDYYSSRFPYELVVISKDKDSATVSTDTLYNSELLDEKTSYLVETTKATITAPPNQGQYYDQRNVLCVSDYDFSLFTGNHLQLETDNALVVGLREAEQYAPYDEAQLSLTGDNRQKRFSYQVIGTDWKTVFGDFRGRDADLLIVMAEKDYAEYSRANPSSRYDLLLANTASGIASEQLRSELQTLVSKQSDAKLLDGLQFSAMLYSETVLTMLAFGFFALLLLVFINSVNMVSLNSEATILQNKYRTVFLLGLGTRTIRRNLVLDLCLPGLLSMVFSILAATIFIVVESFKTYTGSIDAMGSYLRTYLIFIACYVLVMTLFYTTTTVGIVNRTVKQVGKGGYNESH